MVDIKKWGPAAWNFLYAVAFHYPDNPTQEQKQGAVSLFTGLTTTLPCAECREHYSLYMRQFPIQNNVNNRNQLSTWLLNLNNNVNARTGKEPTSLQGVWDRLVEDRDVKWSRFKAALVCFIFLIVAYIVIKAV